MHIDQPTHPILCSLLAVVGVLCIVTSLAALVNWYSYQPLLVPYFPVYSLFAYGSTLGVLFVGIMFAGITVYEYSGKKIRQLKFLPLFVGAAIIIFTLFLWDAIRETSNKNTRAMITFQAIHIKQAMLARLEFEMYAISSMAKRWAVRGGTPQNEWQSDAENFMQYYPNFISLQWVDTDFQVKWAVPKVQSSNVNSTQAIQRRQVLLSSEQENIVSISDIVPLDDGREGFFLYTPVYTKNEFSGYLVGMVDSELFFNAILESEVYSGYSFLVKQGEVSVYKGGDEGGALQAVWGKVATFRIQDVVWHIGIWPTKKFLDQHGGQLPMFVLLVGILIASLLMLAVFLTQLVQKHSWLVFVAHENLRKETIDRQRTEQVKQRLEKALQQSQKLEAVGTLAGGIAHDFNNILYAILGYVEMARQDVPVDSLLYKNLGKVLNAGQRGKKLVSSILSFSRQETHEFAPMDLVKTVDVCFELLKPVVPANIELIKSTNLDEAIVNGSHTDIEQVIINVINNSVDAIENYGSISVDVTLSLAAEEPLSTVSNLIAEKYYCIRIKDDGSGMDEEVLRRLFEPFFTTKEVGSGTGLGLSMAHGIIENHNGIILANSKLDKGTTFYIYLPQYVESEDKKEN